MHCGLKQLATMVVHQHPAKQIILFRFFGGVSVAHLYSFPYCIFCIISVLLPMISVSLDCPFLIVLFSIRLEIVNQLSPFVPYLFEINV
jgi:hypothetical protein